MGVDGHKASCSKISLGQEIFKSYKTLSVWFPQKQYVKPDASTVVYLGGDPRKHQQESGGLRRGREGSYSGCNEQVNSGQLGLNPLEPLEMV